MLALSRLVALAAAASSCPGVGAFSPARQFAGDLLASVAHAPKAARGGNKSMRQIYISEQDARRTNRRTTLASSNDAGGGEGGGADEKKSVSEEIFWAKQRAMAAEFAAREDAVSKQEQMEKFRKRSLALVSDTFYFSVLIGSLLWLVAPNPFVTISYMFGALSGTAYSYGLGKYVESIGGSIDDADAEGAGVGQARFAFLILLFVVVGKFRSQGLLEIPSIMGFFTYQLASLGQGLREIDD